MIISGGTQASSRIQQMETPPNYLLDMPCSVRGRLVVLAVFGAGTRHGRTCGERRSGLGSPAGGVEYCESHPEESRAVHVTGARNVAVAASRCRATVVYYSTDYLFDGEAGPSSEEDEPAPLNAYGHSKWEAEELIREITPKHLILRTTAVFGWDRTSKNFAMQVWEQLQAGKTMRVSDDQWCNPTLVDYLAEASVRLVQAGATGVVNVVGKDRLPRSELAVALAKAMGLDTKLVLPRPTADLGPHYAEFLELARRLRKPLADTFPDFEERRTRWYRLVDSDVLQLLEQGNHDRALERTVEIMGVEPEDP